MGTTIKKCTILSIDGGGIRGIIPAKVLAELESELKRRESEKNLYEHFDLICGTSTGAILYFTRGKLVTFYYQRIETSRTVKN